MWLSSTTLFIWNIFAEVNMLNLGIEDGSSPDSQPCPRVLRGLTGVLSLARIPFHFSAPFCLLNVFLLDLALPVNHKQLPGASANWGVLSLVKWVVFYQIR
jgi:hypothetical protein